jgi:hypothetical protein
VGRGVPEAVMGTAILWCIAFYLLLMNIGLIIAENAQ